MSEQPPVHTVTYANGWFELVCADESPEAWISTDSPRDIEQ